MRHVTFIVALATVAAAVAGCTDPYASRSAYQQGYGYPSGYNTYPSSYGYPANSSYQSGSAYYPTRYGYGSNADYNRNYAPPGSSPQIVFAFP